MSSTLKIQRANIIRRGLKIEEKIQAFRRVATKTPGCCCSMKFALNIKAKTKEINTKRLQPCLEARDTQ